MDIWVTRDRGYRPAEAQETYSLGEIPIDAIFTPIQKVNFVVEHTRVGPMTDFDRLILEDPDRRHDRAGRRARPGGADPGRSRAHLRRLQPQGAGGGAGASPFISDEVQNKPLAELGLSPRVLNALRSRQIEQVGQVLTMDPDQLLSIRNFGPRSLTELREKLAEFGYLPEGDVVAFSGDGELPRRSGDAPARTKTATRRRRIPTTPSTPGDEVAHASRCCAAMTAADRVADEEDER